MPRIELSQHGTLVPSIIHQRSDFASSMVDGRTVMEIGRKSPSTDEITGLWTYSMTGWPGFVFR